LSELHATHIASDLAALSHAFCNNPPRQSFNLRGKMEGEERMAARSDF